MCKLFSCLGKFQKRKIARNGQILPKKEKARNSQISPKKEISQKWANVTKKGNLSEMKKYYLKRKLLKDDNVFPKKGNFQKMTMYCQKRKFLKNDNALPKKEISQKWWCITKTGKFPKMIMYYQKREISKNDNITKKRNKSFCKQNIHEVLSKPRLTKNRFNAYIITKN